MAVGRTLRPVWERKVLYDLVILLRGQGLPYGRIINEVHKRKGIWLSKSHVSDWVNGQHHPYGSTYDLPRAPTPELAYVIGVAKGDGTIHAQQWSYRIRLRVIDKEFAQEFDRCASTVLRSRRHSVRWLPKQGLWCVEICSVFLYRLLRRPFFKLKPIVSHCKKCTAAFVRGFFDSEASMSRRNLEVSNSDLGILSFARTLLRGLKVLAKPPRLAQRGGRFVVIKGKIYHANKNIYRMRVCTDSLGEYNRTIGFRVKRKQDALDAALRTD